MHVGGATDCGQNTRQIHKGGPPWMCGQHNVATARDNTDKGHTPSPRIEIKMSGLAGNRTGPSGWKSGTLSITPRLRTTVEHGRLARWRKWRACDVGKAKEGLGNELWRRWSNRRVGEWAHCPTFPSLHLRHSHSPTLPSLYLRHSSFSNPSVVSPTSQLILQLFNFSYATGSSLTSPDEQPMLLTTFNSLNF